MSSIEQNKQIVREVLESLFRGDIAPLELHPGLEETRFFFPRLMSAFPDLSGAVVQQVAEDDLVSSFARMTGTHRAEWLGVAATGQEVTFDVFSLDRLVDGLIVEHNATADFLRPLFQLGGLPVPSFEPTE
jgi:predicted ester cyclase